MIKVKLNANKLSKSILGASMDPADYGIDGLFSSDGKIKNTYDLVYATNDFDNVNYLTGAGLTSLAATALKKALNENNVTDVNEELLAECAMERDALIAVEYETGNWAIGYTGSTSGHWAFFPCDESPRELIQTWFADIVVENYIELSDVQ